jgi:hypothetical protein
MNNSFQRLIYWKDADHSSKARTFEDTVSGSLAMQDFHLRSRFSNVRTAFESKVRA